MEPNECSSPSLRLKLKMLVEWGGMNEYHEASRRGEGKKGKEGIAKCRQMSLDTNLLNLSPHFAYFNHFFLFAILVKSVLS